MTLRSLPVLAFVFAALSSGCGSSDPVPLKVLEIRQAQVDLSKPDPSAAFWKDVPTGRVTLLAQPMIAPRPETATTAFVLVQAVHDGTRAAFRLRWKDIEKSEAGRLGEYSDAAALQFPLREGQLPPVMMGGKDLPVHLFHWRAQYQRDRDQGKPKMTDLYPNGSVDMYPLEFKGAPSPSGSAAEKFSPGVAEGNPQSYEKTGVDEIVAEGFSTSSVQEGHGSVASAVWAAGEWTLVIVRPLAIEGGSTLRKGAESQIAFAIWQGGRGEVGSRKCITMSWTPVRLP